MNGGAISNLGTPTANSDGTNKLYVDNQKGVLVSYTVVGLPTPVGVAGKMVYVSNESGGAVPAFSDGTNWRRVTDRAIVS